jgi:hypothetical protein
MLRFLRRVQERQLAQTDRWIAAEESRSAQRAERAERHPPPEQPAWAFEYGIGGRSRPPVYVHAGDCWKPGWAMRGITREQALEALTRGNVPACPECRPDAALGILD